MRRNVGRNVGRITCVVACLALLAAGCGGGDDDDSGDAADDTEEPAGDDTDGTAPRETVPEDLASLEVDRSSRFAQIDTFCEPAEEEETEAPEATDEGITEDSVSITHIRVTLEDLEGIGFAIPIGEPKDQVERFVNIINERCGGIHGRMLDLSLVEAPPLAPSGQDPAAIVEAACIEATEDNQAVFAFSGSGWGGQGGASCVVGDHDSIYLTTYTISPDDLAVSDNRLYSVAHSPEQALEYLARTLYDDGELEGKTIGVVQQDGVGEPEIVQAGLIDTLEELGVEVARIDTLGCGGGNSCTENVIPSVQGMIADGVDAIFPLLNVISLPSYIQELVNQGVQPGDIQFFNTSYNAQSGDLVSSKVVDFGGPEAGALYNGAIIVASGPTGEFRLPDYEPSEFGEMCNREYQEAGGPAYSATDPETNSAYGATGGSCSFVRLIARALDNAGPNPTREDLASAMENLGAIDGANEIPSNFAPGKYTAPNQLNRMVWHYPCPEDMKPFGPGVCIIPEGDAFPVPTD